MKKVKYKDDHHPFHLIEKGQVFDVLAEEDGCYKIEIEGSVDWLTVSRFEVIDTVVDSVIESYRERSKVGIEKYGTTMDRDDLSVLEWLDHAQEEAMDFTLYLEKIKNKIKDEQLRKSTENYRTL